MRRFLTILSAAALILMYSGAAMAGDDGDEGIAQFRPRPVSNALPHFGVGVKAGTLGIGVQVGTALASRVNLRGGVNFFDYNDSLTKDGAVYSGTLQLRSVEAKLDLFVIGGFRFTPGLLLYNNNNISATAAVAPGQTLTLGGTTYLSNPANPITGTAALTLNKFAPTLGIGFGNLLPRSARHWSLSTDLGVVFQGSPQFALGLGGSACAPNGTNCQPANNPSVAASVEAERVKIQSDASPFKYYPELSLMFGYKF
jgi:hypothetical protein